MRMTLSATIDVDIARRADGERLRGVVLRQAFAAMLKPGTGGAKGLAQDNWRSMLAEAMADVAARAVAAGGRTDVDAGPMRAVGPQAAREAVR